MPIKPFPRFSLILCLMPVLGLYLLYLRITSSQMAGLLSGPPVPGLHNSQAMAAADFARFWYVGRLLDNLPVNGLNSTRLEPEATPIWTGFTRRPWTCWPWSSR